MRPVFFSALYSLFKGRQLEEENWNCSCHILLVCLIEDIYFRFCHSKTLSLCQCSQKTSEYLLRLLINTLLPLRIPCLLSNSCNISLTVENTIGMSTSCNYNQRNPDARIVTMTVKCAIESARRKDKGLSAVFCSKIINKRFVHE